MKQRQLEVEARREWMNAEDRAWFVAWGVLRVVLFLIVVVCLFGMAVTN